MKGGGGALPFPASQSRHGLLWTTHEWLEAVKAKGQPLPPIPPATIDEADLLDANSFLK